MHLLSNVIHGVPPDIRFVTFSAFPLPECPDNIA